MRLYKTRADNLLWVLTSSCSVNKKCRDFTSLLKKMGFLPQNWLLGEPIPNRPPTKTRWLNLESLCRCGHLGEKTPQLDLYDFYLDGAMCNYLLYLLNQLLCRWPCTVSLNLLLGLLQTSQHAFNGGHDQVGLIQPRLEAHLQHCLFRLSCIYLYLRCLDDL